MGLQNSHSFIEHFKFMRENIFIEAIIALFYVSAKNGNSTNALNILLSAFALALCD